MSLFRRVGIFWYEFTYQGARYRGSTRTGNRELAKRIERKRRERLAEGSAHLDPVQKPMTVTKAVNDFLEANDDWAPRTLAIHENSWRHLKPHFAQMLLQDVTPLAISRYRAARKKEEASARSINIEVALLRAVLIKHRRWHAIAPDFRMLTERKDIGRALSDDEQHRLLAAAKASISRSLYPAILLTIHTGLRHTELRLLRWRQVDLIEGFPTVGKSKTAGGEGRVVPLSQTGLACLKEWRSKFPDAAPEHYVSRVSPMACMGKKENLAGRSKSTGSIR